MNFLFTSNAKKGPHKAFNAYKEFCDKELDGQIVAAAMEHFNMEEFEGKNLLISISLYINTNFCYKPYTLKRH